MASQGGLADPSRTILELIATVMEASFKALGEGVILGTLPRYLEAFGAKNARFIERRYVDCDPMRGAVSALTPINSISRVTGTPFTMVEATQARAVKRLHGCEFLSAFETKAPFSKAMICMLHKAVYQGSVNGLLADPAKGYDVQLQSRILFGDAHCDFLVTSRHERPNLPDQEGPARAMPTGADMAAQSQAFYTAILAAFVDYLTTVLPADAADRLLSECSHKVGAKVARLIAAQTPNDPKASDPRRLATTALTMSGRTVEDRPGAFVVTACPYARPIEGATRQHDAATAERVRRSACGLCLGVLDGAVGAARPGAAVVRDSCMTLGNTDCRFRVEGSS